MHPVSKWFVFVQKSGRVVASRWPGSPQFEGLDPLWEGEAANADEAFDRAKEQFPGIVWDELLGWIYEPAEAMGCE